MIITNIRPKWTMFLLVNIEYSKSFIKEPMFLIFFKKNLKT
jgi:hypothetical protein